MGALTLLTWLLLAVGALCANLAHTGVRRPQAWGMTGAVCVGVALVLFIVAAVE
jgi:hypothetical protein